MCSEREEGGLGLKNLKVFNIALLGKWFWRLYTKNHSLWAKVISSKYGELNTRVNRGERFSSNWLKDINCVESGVWDAKLHWFFENPRRKIGNGANTQFWAEPWLKGQILKNKYVGLFELVVNKVVVFKEVMQSREEENWNI